jgi:hypothetical protein
MKRPTEKGLIELRALMHDTVMATKGDYRLDRIRAALRGIERSPFVEQLLLDYTDAIFRNTERLMADIGAPAN